jgi:MYXO-CTERM domain-containing protein
VTVVLDCAVGSVCSQPAITAISAGTTATPEPRFYAFLTLAILLGAGLFRRLASANNAS